MRDLTNPFHHSDFEASEALRARARKAPTRNQVAWVAIVVWLLAMGAAFWYFGLKDRRPFEVTRLSFFDSQQRAQSAQDWYRANVPATTNGPAPVATVVSFMRPDCPCNRLSEDHLARIQAHYQADPIRFIKLDAAAGPAWVDAAPASLVYDAQGKLVYFGPYSTAAWCGIGGAGGLVESALDRVLKHKPAALQPIYGSGCFCGNKRAT